MKTLLSAVAATALAFTPLAARAQMHGGWDGGHAMAGGGWRGGGAAFGHARGGGGWRRGRRWNGEGRDWSGGYGWRGGGRGWGRGRWDRDRDRDGWGVGFGVGVAPFYDYYDQDWYGPGDYAGGYYDGGYGYDGEEEGYPAAYQGDEDYGPAEDWSPGPDCPSADDGYGYERDEGWGREPRG